MSRSRSRALGVLLAFALLSALPAFGDLVNITADPVDAFQQTSNNPCVIGNSSCDQPVGMLLTQFNGSPVDTSTNKNNTTYYAYSPTYTYSQLVGFLGGATSFRIGIDDNFASDTEDLIDLTVWMCDLGNCTSYAPNDTRLGATSHTASATDQDGVLTEYTAFKEAATGGSAITPSNPLALDVDNGNGYSDGLSDSISIAGHPNAQFLFEAAIQPDSDGMEQFFLIPDGTSPIPEPASIIGFGTALLLTGTRLRRKRRSGARGR